MSDILNADSQSGEAIIDSLTVTNQIETDQIQSNKVIITGELDAGTLKGDGSQLTGISELNGFTFPSVDGNSGDVLQTNGNKTLSFATAATWTVHKTYTGTNSYFEATDLNNPQVVKLVFHEIRHSLAGRNHMFIGFGAGYQTSDYFDVGYTAKDDGTVTRAKQIDKSNWFPLDYNMTNTNSLYSGEIIINKVTTGNDILPYYYTYNSHVEAGLAYGGWSGTVDYYELSWKGHNNSFTYPLNKVKLENGNGGNYTGQLTILSQR